MPIKGLSVLELPELTIKSPLSSDLSRGFSNIFFYDFFYDFSLLLLFW